MGVSKIEDLEKDAAGAIEPQFEPDAERDEEVLQRRLKAIEGLKTMRRPFPPDFKFDREEANAR
ncbi:MAG TPA: hypothetical protein VIM62_07585 [Acidobacteriaceae bacterium]